MPIFLIEGGAAGGTQLRSCIVVAKPECALVAPGAQRRGPGREDAQLDRADAGVLRRDVQPQFPALAA